MLFNYVIIFGVAAAAPVRLYIACSEYVTSNEFIHEFNVAKNTVEFRLIDPYIHFSGGQMTKLEKNNQWNFLGCFFSVFRLNVEKLDQIFVD